MSDFCFVLCGLLPRCGTCCGLPLRVGALLVGIITVVFKLIAVGTDICLLETTFMPPLNSTASTFILEVEYTYLYVALGADILVLLVAGILQCGVITANSCKVLTFILCFFFDWLRMLALFIYEVFLYIEKENHIISGTLCDDLNEFYIRVCLILNFYFFFIVNSYYHKMILRARSRSKHLSQNSRTPEPTPIFSRGPVSGPGVYPLTPVYMQPGPTPSQVQQFFQRPMYQMPLPPPSPHLPHMHPMTQQQMPHSHPSPVMPHMHPMTQQQMPHSHPSPVMPHMQPTAQPPINTRGYSLRPQMRLQQTNPYATMPRTGGYLPSMPVVVTPQVIPVCSGPSMTSNYSSRTTMPSSYPSRGSLNG